MAIDGQRGFYRDIELDEFGKLYINPNGTIVEAISENNTTRTPLVSGTTFTGVSELNTYPDVMVTCKTDTPGNLYIEFSDDGIVWDTRLSFKYHTGRINPPHIFVKGTRYYRVSFENTSGDNQTFLRLTSYFGTFNKLTTPIDSKLAQNFDAIAVRPTDPRYEIALGDREGNTTWNKFGYNDDIDTGTEVIWSVGGSFTRLSTARTLSIVSTSIQDFSGGTGATKVIVYGVDANREEQTEVVDMNGTTPVITSKTWLGVNRIAVYLCGTGENNIGTITATATTDLTVQGQIPAGEGSTQQCIFFTQDNHTALMDWLYINANKLSGGGGSPVITIKGWVYSFVSQSKYLVFRDTIDTQVENSIELRPSQPFVVGENSVVWFEATTNTNNTVVSLRFSLVEVRNN